ncbi:MAG: recombinase RecA [Defluviitoga tunisiensis]|mgnify:CR=1 FL=1|jgi:recombination protein RecA|uniref:Protein RecA n=1 Tax=Defluviitoga tunisiensis TaxID=1006576 RepID=A0A0C7NVD2_DEFTU|nr:recombinase RecA [Defluviitoga tunisiensis]MDD3600790.1 recombinase RecA [Defluviitoga tunisiensis]CEP77403.1 Protein RecA [Defluviitoga tunisiensis]HHV00867.1 recombinase RecA [Defluviitoga tunisiensis]HOB55500.1 recombinase RecA [Defluviitoga tunisiensis]HOK16319.1 recombinase RecA [Defluviitoga tunisiensis]
MAKDDSKDINKDALLEKLVKELEKTHGTGSVMIMGKGLDNRDISVVPTGCLSLDIALGIGGYPRGRIIEIYGNEASGKTTLALQALAEVQKLNGIAAFIDAEHALDIEYAKKLGVDVDKLIVSQPDFGEQALEIVDSLVRSNIVDIIVVDSVAALVPKAEIEGSMGDAHVGLQARLMSQALRKLAGSVSKSKSIVIFINQIRMKIGVLYGNPETTTGGIALKFYSTIRIEARKGAAIREGKDQIGNESVLKVVKNKVAPPFKEVNVDMIFGRGFAKENDIFNLALEEGLIQRKGAWFSYIDDKGEEISLGQGKTNSVAYLIQNPDILDYLEYTIRKKHGIVVPDYLTEKFEKPNKAKNKETEKEKEKSKESEK